MEIKDRIYSLRKQKKITLETLGKMIGVSKQTVSRYESGEINNIPYEKIEALAKALDCTPGYIMGWEDNLNEETGALLADYLEDVELFSYIERIKQASPETRNKILSMIDIMLRE